MRSATYVQAFLYTVKTLFLAVPVIVLVVLVGSALRADALHPERGTQFARTTVVHFSADAELRTAEPVVVRIDSASVRWAAGPHQLRAGTTVTFPEGSAVPTVSGVPPLGGSAWRSALLDRSGAGHPLFETWSLLLATALGTMGLPHILLRFHTSPTGHSARRTAVVTVGLLGAFYLFPASTACWAGSPHRSSTSTGDTDEVVLATPRLSRGRKSGRHAHGSGHRRSVRPRSSPSPADCCSLWRTGASHDCEQARSADCG